MFWRGDPITGARAGDQSNWPRNGSYVKGWPITDGRGQKWLRVTEHKNPGGSWKTLSERGNYFLPFNYGGDPLLHAEGTPGWKRRGENGSRGETGPE
mmetsp:Transcript_107376/g.298650  ORF Transcript_107376/g.298650 Transcript_107376/m.298650 type:complete len:97 (-) Transcript_107376:352-642(-)